MIYDREYLSKLSDDDLNKIHKEMTERYIEELPPNADKENYRYEVNKNLTGRESMISSIVTQYGEMNKGKSNGSDTNTPTFSMKDIDVRIADKTAFADNELKAMDEPTLSNIMMRLAELNALDMKQKGFPQDTEMYIEQVGKVRNKSQMISTIRQIQTELGFEAQEINSKNLDAAKNLNIKANADNIKIYISNAADVKKIAHLLKTEPNTAFFWSGKTNGFGGENLAKKIATENNGLTLESILENNNIEMPLWDMDNDEIIRVWDDTSLEYAKQVSGEIRAIIGKELRKNNVWEKIELPTLLNNPSVTKIIIIDPETKKENVLYERN